MRCILCPTTRILCTPLEFTLAASRGRRFLEDDNVSNYLLEPNWSVHTSVVSTLCERCCIDLSCTYRRSWEDYRWALTFLYYHLTESIMSRCNLRKPTRRFRIGVA